MIIVMITDSGVF